MASPRVLLNLGNSRLSGQARLLLPRAKVPINAVASLTSVNNLVRKPDQRKKPFPYETIAWDGNFKRYIDWFYGVFYTLNRMVDNSKLIIVEGSLATGKNEFGKKLAQEFDMKFMPDLKINEALVTATGYDLRLIADQLSPEFRPFVEELFHTTTDPEEKMKMGFTHMKLQYHRYMRYCNALLHILSTGQGVVMSRSILSDSVFTNSLNKFGYMDKLVRTFLTEASIGVEEFLWKPHVIIYLDAPVDYVQWKIKKRNRPYEANSKALTKEYLEEIEKQYVTSYLKEAEQLSIVLTYDVTENIDFSSVVEDLEELNLESCKIFDDDRKLFVDWYDEHLPEFKMDTYRHQLSDESRTLAQYYKYVDSWKYMDHHPMGISGAFPRELAELENWNPEMVYPKKYSGAIERQKKLLDESFH